MNITRAVPILNTAKRRKTSKTSKSGGTLLACTLAVFINPMFAATANAHIKWFCAFNVAGQPRGLASVLCPDFEYLVGVSMLALLVGHLIEGTCIGNIMLRGMNRLTRPLRENTELLFRAGCGFFFVSIWAVGGILLTPELSTDSIAIAVLQLVIAAGMLSRQTMPFSAVGIATLYAIAIGRYGVFHLADYPVFLGVAAYLLLTGLKRDLFGARPIDIVRWAAGITLMWASIEKWAYPQWTQPLLLQHADMSLGLNFEFFMRAAGAVEFALAFALMWTPLVRRIAAAILATIFVSAVLGFGKVDLIGHTLIVVVMLGIVADDGGKSGEMRHAWWVPVGYACALSGLLAIYYVGHSLLFGTKIA